MTSAADVRPVIDDLKDKLIERSMRPFGFNKHGIGGGYYDTVATAMSDPDYTVAPGWIPGPGGPPTGQVVISAQWAAYVGRGEFNPTVEVYEYWDQMIDGLFAPYLSMPSGISYSLRWTFQDACNALAAEPTPSGGSQLMEHSGNDALASALRAGDGSFAQLEGTAMNAFRLNYWGRIPVVLVRQYLGVRMLGMLCCAEDALWEDAWDDLLALVNAASAGMDSPGGTSTTVTLKAIGAILGLAGKIPIPQAAVFSGIGAAFSVLTAFDDGGTTAREATLPMTSDAEECFSVIRTALEDLSADIGEKERTIAWKARTLLNTFGEDDFLMKRPDEILDTTDPKDVVPNTLNVEASTLDFLADDVLQGVATALDQGADEADVSGYRSGFHRDPIVGYGEYGPFDELNNAVAAMDALLTGNATTLRQVADVLRAVKLSFTETDASAAEAMAALNN